MVYRPTMAEVNKTMPIVKSRNRLRLSADNLNNNENKLPE
jgi:hypothetical protein